MGVDQWFDAGDLVKFTLPMAYSATTLAWGGIDFNEGYQLSGSHQDLVAHLEFVTDYFLRAYDNGGTVNDGPDSVRANFTYTQWVPMEDLLQAGDRSVMNAVDTSAAWLL